MSPSRKEGRRWPLVVKSEGHRRHGHRLSVSLGSATQGTQTLSATDSLKAFRMCSMFFKASAGFCRKSEFFEIVERLNPLYNGGKEQAKRRCQH